MRAFRRSSRSSRGLPLAFAAAAGVHLGALAGGAEPVARATKPVLMPLLAEYVLRRGGPRTLALALLFGCAGDTLLQVAGELPFLLGMGAFAAGHGCYLALFTRHGTGPASRRRLAAGYAAAWAGTTALLWPGLPAGLRPPVAFYGLLLTATAFGALRTGRRAAAGGALFLLSDGLIASGLAGRPQPPAPQFWIMLTYLGAQYLLAEGVLEAADSTEGARHRPDPLRVPGVVRQFFTAARASTMP
ncbi:MULTISPECIES: lysoplasmalogenase [Streptomyces]|uniref:lysoplasmalogenase n=1 Tax=Streptomyces TaxID=1883 RepID=UPI00163BD480|nr:MULTISPECIES: lysoplasmalogenase [Streptomyces]MBC2879386.1 lysoplasmalogenase [Streptomyces sp. TYQ1024]UBI39568.1 lysoplasmalogenase [Streptomyces mobaraensis]UKW32147.1 lysoplasmalogenase [Streptomyces sp. TYQ1024]